MTPTQHIGGATSPEQRYRLEVADRLCDYIAGPFSDTAEGKFTPKQFIARLRDDCGITVTPQAVNYWLNGKWLPSRRNQSAVARVLCIPEHRLFPPYPVGKR